MFGLVRPAGIRGRESALVELLGGEGTRLSLRLI